jgi:hypothetical protein
MTAAYGLYAYGVVDKSPQPLAILGLDKRKVYPVAGRDLCVMVSEIDVNIFQHQVEGLISELTEKAASARNGIEELLRVHEGVVDALMEDTTIIPFQFGTILKDENAVARLLQDDEERFQGLLTRFTGKVEWGLKVYADNQQFMQHIAQVEPEYMTLEKKRARLSRGAAYLLGKKMEEELKREAAIRLTRVSEAIFQELAKEAYEARLSETLSQQLTGKKQEMLLNSVFLVEKTSVAHFCTVGKRLIAQYAAMNLHLEMSGPWAPYSFVC